MTREDAIKVLILCDKKPNWKYTEGMIKTAQEVAAAIVIGQKKPAKLDRGRWDGCDTCKNPIFATCCSGLLNEPVNYCPSCGKPLTEEAWAELERRTGQNDEAD